MLFRLTVVAAALSASGLVFAEAAVKYDIALLPVLCDPSDATKCGSQAFAYGINNDGTVVGLANGWTVEVQDRNCSTGVLGDPRTVQKFSVHAVKWQNGVITDLGHLGNDAIVGFRLDESRGVGINNAGTVVGNSLKEITPAVFGTNGCITTAALNQYRGFMHSDPGPMVDVGVPTEAVTSINAIDIGDDGLIIGNTTARAITGDTVYYTRGFIRSPISQTVTLIPGLQEKTASVLRAVNSTAGKAVGYSIKDGFGLAIQVNLASPSTLVELGTLGGSSSEANDVDADGRVVGRSYTTGNKSIEGFLYDSSATPAMKGLGQLGSNFKFSQPNAINASGDIVGVAQASTGTVFYHATIYSGNELIDLNKRVSCATGSDPRWTLTEAVGINDSGQIIGYGTYGSATRAFVLTPSADTTPPVSCPSVEPPFENKSGGGAFAFLLLPVLVWWRRRFYK